MQVVATRPQENFAEAHWDRFPGTPGLLPFFEDPVLMGSELFTVERD